MTPLRIHSKDDAVPFPRTSMPFEPLSGSSWRVSVTFSTTSIPLSSPTTLKMSNCGYPQISLLLPATSAAFLASHISNIGFASPLLLMPFKIFAAPSDSLKPSSRKLDLTYPIPRIRGIPTRLLRFDVGWLKPLPPTRPHGPPLIHSLPMKSSDPGSNNFKNSMRKMSVAPLEKILKSPNLVTFHPGFGKPHCKRQSPQMKKTSVPPYGSSGAKPRNGPLDMKRKSISSSRR